MLKRALILALTLLSLAPFASHAQDSTSAVHPLSNERLRAGISPDSVRPRPRVHAVEYSDAYAVRLKIHQIGSYVMLPLMGTEYWLGEKLINGTASHGERSTHVAVATGIGVVFGVNTITGVWNLYDSRKDPAGRTRRIIHSAMMLAADAGFVLAAATAGDEGGEGGFGGDDQLNAQISSGGEGGDDANTHKTIALTSFGISAIGTVMMWLWK